MQSKGVGKFRSKQFLDAKSGWIYQWCGKDLSMEEGDEGGASSRRMLGVWW